MRSLLRPIGALASAAFLLAGCGTSTQSLPAAKTVTQSTTRAVASTATAPVIETETVPDATLTEYPEATAQYAHVDMSSLDTSNAVADAQGGRTIPLWQSSVADGGRTYNYLMAGPDPSQPHVTNFDTQIVALSYTFADGTVLSPNNAGCNDTTSVLNRTLGSPIFSNATYPSGTTQYIDAFQRANFWSTGGSDPSFHANFKPRPTVPTLNISVPAAYGRAYHFTSLPCVKIGVVDINYFDGVIAPQAIAFAKTQQLPLLLSYNVFEGVNGPNINGCCILGYHSAFQSAPGAPIQTFSVAAYNDPGIFRGDRIKDIHALSHEFGEWIDDPYGNNRTPRWGHTGQVAGCQGNLEVGDPLTGRVYAPVTTNGYTYHPQELVFFSWFYHQTPSISQNGKYSNNGTFTAPAAACP